MSKRAVKLKLHSSSKFIELKIPLQNPLNASFVQRDQQAVSPIYISVVWVSYTLLKINIFCVS